MIFCYSISHQHAPLAIREQIALTTEQQLSWLQNHLQVETVVVSTCNRLELYARVGNLASMEVLWCHLLTQSGIDPNKVAAYTIKLSNFEAARHLFQVASGLRSMALGEPQILGQVIRAFEQAEEAGTTRHNLSLMFRSAIHTAKQIHTQTMVSSGNISVSSLGISRAEQTVGSLENQPVLVIGAGEMGQTVIKDLCNRQVKNITLVSRTFQTAVGVAETWQITASPITHLKDLLIAADVVFTTSSAPFPILSREDIEPIIKARQGRRLCIIDIAVPRDVADNVAELDGVCLYDLDALTSVAEQNRQQREAAIPQAQQIIDDAVRELWCQYEERAVVPTIRQLREHIESIRSAELARMAKRLPAEHHEQVEALFEEFSRRFMNKILHQPTKNLKVKARQGDGTLFTTVTRDLFGLEEGF